MERSSSKPVIEVINFPGFEHAPVRIKKFLEERTAEGFNPLGYPNLPLVLEYFGTDSTLIDLGRLHVSDSRSDKAKSQLISSRIKRTIEMLHAGASQDLQDEFPLESLLEKKPATESERNKRSRKMGGIRREVRKALDEGAGTTQEVLDKLGMAEDQYQRVDKCLEVMRRTGRAPESYKQKTLRLRKIFSDPEVDDEKLREAYKEADRSFFMNNRSLFITIVNLARLDQYRFNSRDIRLFVKALELEKVPYGHFVYERRSSNGSDKKKVEKSYFVTKHQMVTALVAFSEHIAGRKANLENLELIWNGSKRERSELTESLPSTTDFKDPEKYRPIFLVVRKAGLEIGEILSGCPARIIRYRKSYYVPTSEYDALMAHLSSKTRRKAA